MSTLVLTPLLVVSQFSFPTQMVRSTGSGISHCPNSNFSLKSGVCNVQRLRRAGVKVFSWADGWFIPCWFQQHLSHCRLRWWIELKVRCDIWVQHDHFSRWVLERTALEDSHHLSWTRCAKQSQHQMLSTSLDWRTPHCHSGWIPCPLIVPTLEFAAMRCTWRPEAVQRFLPGRGSWACWKGEQLPTSSWSIWTVSEGKLS